MIGSLNPLTQEQIRLAARHAGVRVHWLHPWHLRRSAPTQPMRLVRGSRWTVLALHAPSFRSHLLVGQHAALAAGERVAQGIARYAAALITRLKPAGLLLSGGLTAATVLKVLGIRSLALKYELSPGVVASEAYGPLGQIWVITKPGGFGSPDILLKLAMD